MVQSLAKMPLCVNGTGEVIQEPLGLKTVGNNDFGAFDISLRSKWVWNTTNHSGSPLHKP